MIYNRDALFELAGLLADYYRELAVNKLLPEELAMRLVVSLQEDYLNTTAITQLANELNIEELMDVEG